MNNYDYWFIAAITILFLILSALVVIPALFVLSKKKRREISENNLKLFKGEGTCTFTYTVIEEDTQWPVEDAIVKVSKHKDGLSGLVAKGRTNADGVIVFWLDPGDYYMKIYKYRFSKESTVQRITVREDYENHD